MFLLFEKGILSGSMLVDWIIYKSRNFPARKQGLCHLLGRHDFRRPCWWCRQHRCRPVVERKSAIFNCIPCKCLKSKHNLSVLKIKRKKTCPRNHEIIKSWNRQSIWKSSNHPNHQSIWKSSNHQIIKSTFFPIPIFTSSAGSKQVGSSLQHHGRRPADSRRNLPSVSRWLEPAPNGKNW